MNQKSEVEMERLRTIKIIRTLTRLKHSIQIDKELNEILPASLLEFDAGLQAGELRIPTQRLLNEILES